MPAIVQVQLNQRLHAPSTACLMQVVSTDTYSNMTSKGAVSSLPRQGACCTSVSFAGWLTSAAMLPAYSVDACTIPEPSAPCQRVASLCSHTSR